MSADEGPAFLASHSLSAHEAPSASQGARLVRANHAPLSDFEILAEKNIFHPERKDVKKDEAPQETKKPEEPTPTPGPPSDIKLTGIIAYGGENQFAYIIDSKAQKPAIKKYRLGDTIAGYTLSEILSDRIKLEVNGEISVLKLAGGASKKGGGAVGKQSGNLSRNAAAQFRNRATTRQPAARDPAKKQSRFPSSTGNQNDANETDPRKRGETDWSTWGQNHAADAGQGNQTMSGKQFNEPDESSLPNPGNPSFPGNPNNPANPGNPGYIPPSKPPMDDEGGMAPPPDNPGSFSGSSPPHYGISGGTNY